MKKFSFIVLIAAFAQSSWGGTDHIGDAAYCTRLSNLFNLTAVFRDQYTAPQESYKALREMPAFQFVPNGSMKEIINKVYFDPKLQKDTPPAIKESAFDTCYGVKPYAPPKTYVPLQ